MKICRNRSDRGTMVCIQSILQFEILHHKHTKASKNNLVYDELHIGNEIDRNRRTIAHTYCTTDLFKYELLVKTRSKKHLIV